MVPTSVGQEGGVRGREGQKDLGDLVKCLLSEFTIVSKTRLHNLAFLAERDYYTATGERLTSADYRPYLQGCYSEDIEQELTALSGVRQKSVKIGGEKVAVLKVNTEFECGLSDQAEETVQSVIDTYGETIPEEVQQEIFDSELHTMTGSGDVIDFSEPSN